MDDPFKLSRSLFMITDPDVKGNELREQIVAGVRGGVSHVLLRRPTASASGLYQLAINLPIRRPGERGGPKVIVHDRIDVAVGAHAAGAHLPKGGLPGGVAKSLLGEQRMLGTSVHNKGQANSAVLQMADYLMFGHVYETDSHPGQPGRGLNALREVCERFPYIPVIAVGGITPERVDEVLAAGASGVAVIRTISQADDPEAAARDLRQAIDAADYPHLHPRKEAT